MESPSAFIHPGELWRTLGLRAEQTVVHLGCGAGYYLIPAAKIVGPRGKVVGVDIRPDMLAEAENRANRDGVDSIIDTIRANLEEEKVGAISDGSADWVLVANILHQADPHKLLPEARRIVRPIGNVVIVEWDTAASPLGPPAHLRRSAAEVIELAEQIGLTLAKRFQPSPYHYGLLFTPPRA